MSYNIYHIALILPPQVSRSREPVDKSFLRKTAHLVQEHTHTREIHPPQFEHRLTPEALRALAEQDKPENVKIFNLLVAIRKIVEEESVNTPYLISIGEKAQTIAEAFEEHLDSAQEALLKLIEVVEEYEEVQKRRKQTDLSDEAFTTLIYLEKSGIKEAQKISRESAQLFDEHPLWRESHDQEREVKAALYKALKGSVGTKKMVELVRGLLTILKNLVVREARADQIETLEDIVPVELFRAEVKTWTNRVRVEPREIHIRPMSRKWASCSSRGRLTFSTALLREPAPFRAEVIVHELVHLKVPNHGKVFKALVKAHLANTSR